MLNKKEIAKQSTEKYIDEPRILQKISENTNDIMEMIENNQDKLWDWYGIKEYLKLTVKFIDNNQNKDWDWENISENKFTKEKELFYQKYYRIYMATFRLQQYFNRMYDNPKYLFCRNRLDRLFSE